MAFPSSPINGQSAIVNGISYSYSSTDNAWTRVTATNLTLTGNLTTGNLFLTSTGNLVIPATTNSVNTTTGALVVVGGAGIGGALYIGNTGDVSANIGTLFTGNNVTNANIGAFQTYANTKIGTNTNSNLVVVATTTSTSTTTGALVVTGGVGVAGNLNVGSGTSGYKATFASPGAGTLGVMFIGASLNSSGNGLVISSTTRTVADNAVPMLHLIARDGTVALSTTVQGNTVIGSTTTSISTTTGALVVAGGAGISGAIYNGGVHVSSGNIVAASGTASTSATTGALVVSGGAGISGNVFTSGWMIPTSNVSQNLGTTTSWWNTFYGVSTQARYADLAENYQADNNYEPGTVLVFGGNMEVTISTVSHDTAVAGIVSTNPAHLMNGALNGINVIPLALQGRVPCWVKGPVNKGTLLVTSDIPGIAEALEYSLFKPGCVLGKSLESIVDNSIKTIEVVVGRF